jgi:hypothetical protein
MRLRRFNVDPLFLSCQLVKCLKYQMYFILKISYQIPFITLRTNRVTSGRDNRVYSIFQQHFTCYVSLHKYKLPFLLVISIINIRHSRQITFIDSALLRFRNHHHRLLHANQRYSTRLRLPGTIYPSPSTSRGTWHH